MTNVEEQIKYAQATLAGLGRQYPANFIAALADESMGTVREWLTNHQAPAAILDLLSSITILERYTVEAAAGTLSDLDAAEVPGIVAEAAQLIATCGGSFHSSMGIIPTMTRPDPPGAG